MVFLGKARKLDELAMATRADELLAISRFSTRLDDPALALLRNQLDELEVATRTKFFNDFSNASDDILIRLQGGEIEGWKRLDDLGVNDVARRNLDNVGQSSTISKHADDIDNATNAQKGNFGEIGADLDLNLKGYESLQPRISDINAPGHNGIDGIYRAPDGSYVILEGKYTGSASLNPANPATNLDRQMSDAWIQADNRLFDALGGNQDLVDDILDSGYERVLAQVSPDGSVSYKYVSETGYLSQGGGPLGNWTP